MRKKFFGYLLVVMLYLFCAVTVSAIGFSFYDDGKVSINQGGSKTYGEYTVNGTNVVAQSDVTDKSTSTGYVQIAYKADRKNWLGSWASQGTQTINVYSNGWVGGNWTGVSPGTFKFTYTLKIGSVSNMGYRMYDY